MKREKGFTLIEVVISIALIGIIAVGFLAALSGQYRILTHTQNMTEDTFLTQKGMEQQVDLVKQAFANDTVTPSAILSPMPVVLGVSVGAVSYEKTFASGSGNAFYTVIADTREAAGFPSEITDDQLTFRKSAVPYNASSTYSDVPGLDIRATWTPILSDTGYIHRWYASEAGFNIPTQASPGGDTPDGKFPSFPFDYRLLDTDLYKSRDFAPDFSAYKGKHIVHTVTPVSAAGKMGETYFSDALMISGLPDVNTTTPVRDHLDASLITSGRASGSDLYVENWKDVGVFAGLSNRSAMASNAVPAQQPQLLGEPVGSVLADSGLWRNTHVQYLRFDGVDDTMTVTENADLTLDAMTLFFVFRTAGDQSGLATVTPHTVLDSRASGTTGLSIGWNDQNQVGLVLHDAMGAPVDEARVLPEDAGIGLDGKWHVFTAVVESSAVSGAAIHFSVDGNDPVTVTRTAGLVMDNNPIQLAKDALAATNAFAQVDMAELVACKGVLSPADNTSVREYLANKYQPITPTLTVLSLQKMNAEVLALNELYTLPVTAKANMSNGGTSMVGIYWTNAADAPVLTVDTSTAGSIVYKALLTSNPAITRTKSFTVMSVKNLVTPAAIDVIQNSGGGTYTPPDTVTAVMSDDSTKSVKVDWTPASVSTTALTGGTPLRVHGVARIDPTKSTNLTINVVPYVPPVIGGTISITGSPYVGSTLVAVANLTNAGTATYQWYRNGTAIPGATTLTYAPVTADLNRTLTIRATADGTAGTGSVTSAGVTIVTRPPMTGSILITGIEYVGNTLRAVPDLMNATGVTYQWYRGSYSWWSGWSWNAISGATALTYTLQAADLDDYVLIEASLNGTEIDSSEVGPIRNKPAIGGWLAISGSPYVGRILTTDASHLINAGNPTFAWYRGTDVIAGATGSSYHVVAADIGKRIKVVATADGIEGVGSISSPQTAAVVDSPLMSGSVTITGTLQYGATLTANTTNIRYTPSITDDEPTYVWSYSKDGADVMVRITTTNRYTIDDAVVIGRNMKVTVKANPLYARGEVTSSSYGPVIKAAAPAAPGRPVMDSRTSGSITLAANMDYQYKRDTGAWQDSPVFTGLSPNVSYNFYQRYRETETRQASASSASQAITTLKLEQAPPPAPVLSSKTATSITLVANASYEYRLGESGAWVAGNTFSGLQAGTAYTFYARLKETSTYQASPAGPALAVTTNPSALSSVSLSGTTQYGQFLTAIPAYTPATTLDVPTYQWTRNGTNIPNATSVSYLLVADDIGKTIGVRVTADGVHATGSATRSTTSTIAKADGPDAPYPPTEYSTSTNTIVLTPFANYEYRIRRNGSWGAWQTSSTFSGLSSWTTYRFQQRIAETATQLASDPSDSSYISTDWW